MPIFPIKLRHLPRLIRAISPVRLLRFVLPGAIAGAAMGLAGCSPTGEGALYRPRTYAFPVPPEVTFDLRSGQEIPDAELAGRLSHVRVLFLGEYHDEPRSHAFQARVISLLKAAGRDVTVALEMLTPEADKALEGWRTGKLSEPDFLEQSRWYRRWGFPWQIYKPVFDLVRKHKLPIHGINAEEAERAAARKDDLSGLSPAQQQEIGDLRQTIRPHTMQLEDMLSATRHGGSLRAGSEKFESMRRVQWLWERLMGQRAARLAEAAEGKSQASQNRSIVVVLIGSGHLRNGLGAQLHAARTTPLPTLSVVDKIVSKDDGPLYPVAVGTGDLVRVYARPPAPPEIPTLAGLKLVATNQPEDPSSTPDREEPPAGQQNKAEDGKHGDAMTNKADQSPAAPEPQGVKIAAIAPYRKATWPEFQPNDILTHLNGKAVGSPTHLRLAWENLKVGETVELKLVREEKPVTIELVVKTVGF